MDIFEMLWSQLVGPYGIAYASGGVSGVFIFWRFLLPKFVANEVKACEARIEALENEIDRMKSEYSVFEEWAKIQIEEALNAKKN